MYSVITYMPVLPGVLLALWPTREHARSVHKKEKPHFNWASLSCGLSKSLLYVLTMDAGSELNTVIGAPSTFPG